MESHSQVTKYRPVDSTIDFLTPESPSLPLINIQTNVNAHESAATVVLVIQHDVATLSWYWSGVECCRTCSWCPEYRTALLSITRHDHVHLIILLNHRLIYSLKNKEKCVSLLILDKLNDESCLCSIMKPIFSVSKSKWFPVKNTKEGDKKRCKSVRVCQLSHTALLVPFLQTYLKCFIPTLVLAAVWEQFDAWPDCKG